MNMYKIYIYNYKINILYVHLYQHVYINIKKFKIKYQ